MIAYCIFLTVVILLLVVMTFITTDHLNSRIIRNEDYLSLISEEMKQIKILLKREVAMANSESYPVVQSHITYRPLDKS